MKKIITIALAALLIVSCFAIGVSAADETKIGVYEINPEYYSEGITCIYTNAGRTEGTLGEENESFGYWAVAAFEYDAATGGYKCVDARPGDSNPKSDVVIPENGFVIASNSGNDWPSLFASATGDEWFYADTNAAGTPYAECPNFVTAQNEANKTAIGTIAVGDIYYLVNANLDSAYTDTNASDTIHYYDADFVTNTYLTNVKPEETDESSEAPATSSEAPATSSEAPATSSAASSEAASKAPVTGDAGLVAFAVIALVAAAGVVVVKKSR